MRLIIMRHGHSPSAVEAGVKHDHDRPLSDAGRAAARAQAGRLAAEGLVPDLILHSPYTRAAQTAHEVRRALGGKPRLEEWLPLENQLPGPEVYKRLCEGGPRRGLTMLVGHMPQLGELASGLLGVSMGFAAAQVLVVEGDALGSCRVVADLSPEDD
ncbi:MAG: histidine phosphatase family protein [Elusimicrobia bacterium]|nr:histidine phosphatase family protein [Elusimicrobiota bacterium]